MDFPVVDPGPDLVARDKDDAIDPSVDSINGNAVAVGTVESFKRAGAPRRIGPAGHLPAAQFVSWRAGG
jgi:hypothetical protein